MFYAIEAVTNITCLQVFILNNMLVCSSLHVFSCQVDSLDSKSYVSRIRKEILPYRKSVLYTIGKVTVKGAPSLGVLLYSYLYFFCYDTVLLFYSFVAFNSGNVPYFISDFRYMYMYVCSFIIFIWHRAWLSIVHSVF